MIAQLERFKDLFDFSCVRVSLTHETGKRVTLYLVLFVLCKKNFYYFVDSAGRPVPEDFFLENGMGLYNNQQDREDLFLSKIQEIRLTSMNFFPNPVKRRIMLSGLSQIKKEILTRMSSCLN